MTADDMTPTEALVRQLYGLRRVLRDIGRHALVELGGQGFTALAVVAVQGPLRVSDVALDLGVDLSVASRQLAALAADGYVERRPDANDRRAQLVEITPAGRRALTDAHRRMVAAFDEVLSGWSDAEVDALRAGIDRLRADHAALEQQKETA